MDRRALLVDLRRRIRIDRHADRRTLRRLADRGAGRHAAPNDYVGYTPRPFPAGARRTLPGQGRGPGTHSSTISAGLYAPAAWRQSRRHPSARAAARRVVFRSSRVDLTLPRLANSTAGPRAYPPRPVCLVARRRAAGRSRPSDRAFGRRNLSAVLPCATLKIKLTFDGRLGNQDRKIRRYFFLRNSAMPRILSLTRRRRDAGHRHARPRTRRLSEPADQARGLPAGRRRRRHRLADHRREDVESPRPAGRSREQGRPVRQSRRRVRLRRRA